MENELAYMGNVAQGTASESITDYGRKMLSSKRSTTDFGNYLDKAYESKQSEADKRVDVSKTGSRDKQLTKKTENPGKKAQYVNKNKPQEDPKEKPAPDALKTVKSDETGSTPDAAANVTDKIPDEKQLIAKIAELLEVPEDQVLQALNALNISVFDLQNKEILPVFMQELYSVSDVTELLNIPNIKDLFVQVSEIIKNSTNIPEMPSVVEEAYAASQPIDLNMTAVSEIKSNESSATTQPLDEMSNQAIPEISVEQVEITTEQDVSTEPNILVQAENISETPVSELPGEELLPELINDTDDFQTIMSTTDTQLVENFSGLSESGYGNQEQENNPDSKQDINFNSFSNHSGVNINTDSNMIFRETQLKNLSTSNINTRDVVDQIVNKMKVEIKANITEVKLTLKPESLGEVSLKISMENGIVTAQFTAESQRVKAIIESNFNQLRDTLQQQGISVSELYVSVEQQDKAQERMEEYNRSRQKSASRIRQIISAISNEEGQGDETGALSGLDERIVDVTA